MTVVNLNKARKARAKDEKRAKADANAVAFGRTKAEREADRASRDAQKAHLDGHKRDGIPEN
ncbi:MAG: DUF4169 family protein [Rhodobacteraceae bacterium]|nr:DUF4169 family protein [Paracoccaceae bacterium]